MKRERFCIENFTLNRNIRKAEIIFKQWTFWLMDIMLKKETINNRRHHSDEGKESLGEENLMPCRVVLLIWIWQIKVKDTHITCKNTMWRLLRKEHYKPTMLTSNSSNQHLHWDINMKGYLQNIEMKLDLSKQTWIIIWILLNSFLSLWKCKSDAFRLMNMTQTLRPQRLIHAFHDKGLPDWDPHCTAGSSRDGGVCVLDQVKMWDQRNRLGWFISPLAPEASTSDW